MADAPRCAEYGGGGPEGRSERREWRRSLALGQIISLLITGTGICSTGLAAGGLQAPISQSSLNYFLLCGFRLRRHLSGPGAGAGGPSVPAWQYALWAACDVEANFLVVSAYQYTSITSVMLLDCFTIPCAMVLSTMLLSAQYEAQHLVACIVCVAGMGLTVYSDVASGRAGPAPKGPVWVGDLLALSGAALYGLSNVLQERLLKRGAPRGEVLGSLGMWGSLISLLQALCLERGALGNCSWTADVVLQLLGFQLCLFGMYVLTSVFLSSSDAAVFNLSLLTSDAYAVVYASLRSGQWPTWLYAFAFATTIGGLVLYHATPVAAVERPVGEREMH